MKFLHTLYLQKKLQYPVGILLVTLTAFVCSFLTDIIGYQIVAFLLLLIVSVLAMVFDILPVLVCAVLSALLWNFFFIQPRYTFSITAPEDALMFLMYFVIAIINAVLTSKIRQFEKAARSKEEKENAIKLYNTLLNSLSHELRTPISTIIGAVDTLKESSKMLSEENKMELLYEIEKASIRLNHQVENLLNMSRLETGILSLRLDWCDVNELIHQLLMHNREISAQHQVLFNSNESLPLFKIDSMLLEQVLQNILQNAIQYTPAGSVIQIKAEHKNNNCCIEISDNGQGFPDNHLPLVFNKFYRLAPAKVGGLGLGLSIAKGFVEAHGGQIELQNNPTGGAIFTISLPAETSSLNHLKNE